MRSVDSLLFTLHSLLSPLFVIIISVLLFTLYSLLCLLLLFLFYSLLSTLYSVVIIVSVTYYLVYLCSGVGSLGLPYEYSVFLFRSCGPSYKVTKSQSHLFTIVRVVVYGVRIIISRPRVE